MDRSLDTSDVSQDHIIMQALLEELLYMLAADGEEKTFDYIRNTVLKTKDY